MMAIKKRFNTIYKSLHDGEEFYSVASVEQSALKRLELSSVPKDTAVKLANYLIKTYGGTKYKSAGSNVYADFISMSLRMDEGFSFKELGAKLKAEGWTMDTLNLQDGYTRYSSPGKDDNRVSLVGAFNGKSKNNVSIIGPKKAKNSNLPYYD